ncbi:MAG TPA: zinc-ribbon domain-containing protein [Geobacterales bacterium]|nr:zinc-ribbon domain-containing protein [Geobacterales bacterium]
MLVECPNCFAKYRIDDDKIKGDGVKLRCAKCQNVFPVTRTAPVQEAPASMMGRGISVVVANESAAFCEAVRDVLVAEPFEINCYTDGIETMAAVERIKPNVVLLDVALPRMYGFEICEKIKHSPELADVKVILIAAIYDKTRYKREPKNLYHADDYIEKHHIPDQLVEKIYTLAGGGASAAPQAPQASMDAVRRELKRDEESISSPAPAPGVDAEEAHSRAKRFARTIVSDIALYNQDKVEEGVKNGTIFKLLGPDIEEGRALYESRVGKEILATTSYLKEAFDDLIARKKKELNL